MTKMDREWRKLLISPVDCNGYFKLELPKAKEPSDSSETSLFGKRKEAQYSFLNGN
jgi:hypothetical protein